MFTTTTATRKQVLKAVAATHRAMERHACSKSQFKFKCFSCGKMIHRGDKITRCVKSDAGMTLRYRGAGGECGLTLAESAFYRGDSGKDMWVHIGCIPCYWDKGLDEDGNRLTHPKLRPICTEWGVKVYGEWDELTEEDVWYKLMGVPYYCKVKGYPEEKFMRDRIVHAVTRFQALWRGYIYKKAYPIARLEAIAKRILNEACSQSWSGQEVPDLITKRQREAERNARSRNGFLHNNCFGAHMEILFDEKRTSAAIYSGEVIKIQGEGGDGLYYWVKFHHDGEVRRYHWKRLLDLKSECKTFKSKHGIQAEIKGKISIYCFIEQSVRVYKKKRKKKK